MYHTDQGTAKEQGSVQVYISRLFSKPTRLNSNAACNCGKPHSMIVNPEPGKLGFSQDIYLAIGACNKELKVKIKVKFEKKLPEEIE